MIIDCRKKKLIYRLKRREIYKLSKNELRILILLSDNYVHNLNELIEFSYCNSLNSFRQVICRLKRKIKCINIKTILITDDDDVEMLKDLEISSVEACNWETIEFVEE